MGNLNVVVAGSKDFADAVGKKGTITDMTFFEIKKGNDSVTLIEPSKYPEKLSSLFYGVSMAEYAILVVEKIESFLGETIVMIDSLGANSVHATMMKRKPNLGPRVPSRMSIKSRPRFPNTARERRMPSKPPVLLLFRPRPSSVLASPRPPRPSCRRRRINLPGNRNPSKMRQNGFPCPMRQKTIASMSSNIC